MPNYTKNYNLIKPNKTENYDIEDVTNKNMDIIDEELFGKVDKVPGKALSTNDFTNEYKNKLDKLENYNDEELKNKLNEQVQKNNLQEEKIEELNLKQINLQTENSQLKNQIPTGTAEGESIYLSDSSDLEAKIIVKGNSKQEKRIGSNILNFNVSQNGKVTVNNDGTLTINGTGGFGLNFDSISLKSGTTYYEKFELISGNINGTDKNNCIMSFDGSSWLVDGQFVSFTPQADNNKSSMWLNASATFENAVIRIWANIDQSDFEPYGVMPSPNYPSNVETVGSNVNEFDLQDENSTLFGVNYTIKNGIIVLNGTANADGNIFFTNKQDVKLNGIYSFSINNEIALNSGCYFRLYSGTTGYDLVLSFGAITEINHKDENVKIDNITFRRLALRVQSGTVFNNFIIKPKIERRTKATPYSPYGQGSVEIDVGNKNLAKINETDWELTENNTIKNKAKNDGKELTRFNLNKGQTIKIGLKLLQKPTKSSTFSFYVNAQTGVITSFTNYNNYNLNQIYERSYTATENTEILIKSWGNADNETIEIQLWAELDKLTNYTLHQSQTKIVPIQEEMLEDDYISDVEYHTWGKVILTGNEDNWNNYNRPTDDDIYVSIAISNLKVYGKVQCTHFKYMYNWTSGTNTIYIGGSSDILIRVDKNIATDVNTFKAWLQEKYNSGNPVVVYYKLATPKSLPLTEQQKNILDEKTYTYKNVTNINTDSIAILDVTYKKDLETMINNIASSITNSVTTNEEV